MSHLQINRNHVSEISMIKQAVQYTFFLVVCIWLLYQIHHSLYVRRDSDCDFIENGLIGDRIANVLGRKAGVKVGKSHYTEEVELYGVDLIGEAVRISNATDADYDNSDGKPNSEGNGAIGSFENDVILKKDEKVETFMFSDENGVPDHEYGPAKRSEDVEIEVVQNGSVSNAGNLADEMDECRSVCPHNVTDTKSFRSEKGSMRDLLFV